MAHATATVALRGLTGDELEWHRSAITRMYVQEQKTLRQVMGIMEREYQVRASVKVYKSRLARWGLYKNSGYGPSHGGRSKTHPHDGQARPFKENTVQSTRPGRLRHRAAIPERMNPEDGLVVIQDIFDLSGRLVLGLLDAGMVDRSNLHSLQNREWIHAIEHASRFFKAGQYRTAFNHLNGCFDKIGPLLNSVNLELLPIACIGTLQLYSLDPVVSRQFVKFAVEMASIRLPERHPFRQMWTRLSRMETKDFHRNIYMILKSFLKIIQQHVGFIAVNRTFAWLHDRMDSFGSDPGDGGDGLQLYIEPEEIERDLRDRVDQARALGHTEASYHNMIPLAFHLFRHGKLDMAEKENNAVLQWLQAQPVDRIDNIANNLFLRVVIEEKRGRYEHAARAGIGYMAHLLKVRGPHDPAVVSFIAQSQGWDKKHGWKGEAIGYVERLLKMRELRIADEISLNV